MRIAEVRVRGLQLGERLLDRGALGVEPAEDGVDEV